MSQGARHDDDAQSGGPRLEDAASPINAAEEDLLVFTRQAVRNVDRLAVERYGIPSIVLMENAAIHLADIALQMLSEIAHPRVLIICGPGNNGGDGLALARHLDNAGLETRILLASEAKNISGDAATNLAIAKSMNLPIFHLGTLPAAEALDRACEGWKSPDLIVDALLGTGLSRPVDEPLLSLIGTINDLQATGAGVLCVDLPSGLDCDTGQVLGDAVCGVVTVSFVGLKAGFLNLAAQDFLGDVIVADIGAPQELARSEGVPLEEARRWNRPETKSLLEQESAPLSTPGRAESGQEGV